MILSLKFKIYSISDEEIKPFYGHLPNEKNIDVRNSTNIIQIPTTDGVLHDFKIVEYDMMEPELKSKFPDIRRFMMYSRKMDWQGYESITGIKDFVLSSMILAKTFIDYK